MADRMTDEAKAQALERVAKLIEDNLGYKVDRKKVCEADAHIRRLDLEGLSHGFNAFIVAEDVEKGAHRFRTVYTADVKVIVTNVGFGRRGDRFKKWSILSNLNFDKGTDDKKTAAFLAKVKELVEITKAREQRHLDNVDEHKRNKEYMAEWEKDGVPEGFKLVDNWEGKHLVPIAEGERSYYSVRLDVVSDKRAEELGDQPHIRLGKVIFPDQHRIAGDKVNEFMRLYRQLYEFAKSCETS